ncbi:MAG: rhomboid family intramembrane serine protease [Parvularcula sp.]|jgi:membrane associated rhomboid family serine protease|nr:rhomboid family intramembrane serine protease [Parvularcula sp.]
MTERPSTFRRRQGLNEGGVPFRGGPILNLPTPIGPIVFWTVVVSFLAFVVPSPFGRGPIFNDLSFVPVLFLSDLENGNLVGALVPLLSHMFLHGGIGHLALNMLWLMVFGSGIARRLCIEADVRHRRRNIAVFFAFYVACGIAGALTHFATHPLDNTPMIGASGAISGLMAGTLRFALRLFAPAGAEYGRLAPVWARPVAIASLVYIGLNLATGLVEIFALSNGPMIAWEAHIGGYLFGLFAFPFFDRMAKRPPLPFGLG